MTYVLLKLEDGKYYDSRHVRFTETLVYVDLYGKNRIKGLDLPAEEIDKSK